MRIAISGSHGLIGTALVTSLIAAGHQVFPLVRRPAKENEIEWNISLSQVGSLDGIDGIIHLAGESIQSPIRWSAQKKQQISVSRIDGTQLLCNAIQRMKLPPSFFISASAIGYYGHSLDHHFLETDSPGTSFFSHLVQNWEQASMPLTEVGVRVVHLRLGMVLSRLGGALSKMLLPARFGLLGPVGSGHQYWSWIDLSDLISIIHFLLATPAINGPVNLVAPHPVTQHEFVRALAQTFGRSARLPLPAWCVNLVMGEMGKLLLLNSAYVIPKRLNDAGFLFQYPTLSHSLTHCLDG